jgi:alanine transaminase
MSTAPQLVAATLNRCVRDAEYAVRGPIVVKANELEADLKKGVKHPFSEVIYCNIGNPHQLGQRPLTFPRQVLSLMTCPWLIDEATAAPLFPKDARDRARKYLAAIGVGGTGAYSHSQGVLGIREDVAEFIRRRDGFPCSANAIWLTDGASPGVKMMVQALIADKGRDGLMIPIPQYPLYTATLALEDGTPIPYFLDEKAGWSTTIPELERALSAGREAGRNPRGLVVINPGNPTGACIPDSVVRDIAQFASDKNLVLMADEVYQENLWKDGASFYSFRKAACDLGLLDPTNPNSGGPGPRGRLQLASFHSVSKGFLGECGRRGGFMELCGFDDEVRGQLYKLSSINLCSNLDGQVMTGLMVNPPAPGDESHATYVSERDAILASLKRRATKLAAAFSSMEGVSCADPDGAMYAFPKISIPAKAVAAAKDAKMAPDAFYCMEMLKATGIVTVPGSGFGQEEGTFHLRMTILPSEAAIDSVISKMSAFQAGFLAKYK